MHHYVYITTNLINGHQYVGDRTCECLPEKDIKYLGSGKPYFNDAKKKYGKKNFKKEVLEIFENRLDAGNSQAKYIVQYNTLSPNGYNISPTGGCNYKGWHHSEETKNKLKYSITEAWKKPGVKEKLSLSLIEANKNPETKLRRSIAQKKAQNRPEIKENASKIQKELNKKDEVKLNKSISQLNAQNKPEVKEKKRISHLKHNENPFIKIERGKKIKESFTSEVKEKIKYNNILKYGISNTLQIHKISCEYCGKIMNYGNYARWHGEKCKLK